MGRIKESDAEVCGIKAHAVAEATRDELSYKRKITSAARVLRQEGCDAFAARLLTQRRTLVGVSAPEGGRAMPTDRAVRHGQHADAY